jgi:hypothetical protein
MGIVEERKIVGAGAGVGAAGILGVLGRHSGRGEESLCGYIEDEERFLVASLLGMTAKTLIAMTAKGVPINDG